VTGELAVREPRQRRTREQWDRILDAGVQLLEDDGYEGFTIAALCARAGVAPPALYARAATKDALFLAVYERGMSRVLADHHVFAEPDRWHLETDPQRVEQAVRYLVQIFLDHAAFLRAVVLVSGAHPEVRRRGEAYRSAISELFTSVLTPLEPNPLHSDQGAAREFCFSLVFSAMVLRTAYGPGFGPAGDADVLTNELVTMSHCYLLTRL
jgi:AcrR family transcriptional regulator